MNDIFISHSSEDRKYAEAVCSRLECAGFKCWVSYRITDLQPGKIYTQRITEAIDSSKVFLLLLSNNSIKSEQVLQEVISANERQRYGLKIFPVVLDDNVDMTRFHINMGYVFAGKEMFLWHDVSAQEELIKEIGAFLNAGNITDTAKIASYVPECGSIVGRESEKQAITTCLHNTGKLWIDGIGGIGKTALLLSFCNNETAEYQTVVYLSVEKCIARTLDNDRQLVLTNEKIAEKRQILSNYEYALYKLSVLENSVRDSVLIVLDNVEDINDPLLERFCSLNCNIIIASRCSGEMEGFARLTIRELTETKSIHELFNMYYGSSISAEEYYALDGLLSGVRYHTMTVVLIAKQMSYFGKLPSDYGNRNQLTVERTKNLSQIMSGAMADHSISAMYIQLFDLFDATTLSMKEKTVMKTICLLPSEGMYRHLYLSLVGEENLEAVIKLEKMGWIQNDSEKKFLFVHPLVRDVVLHELNLFLDDPDITLFFKGFISMISDCWTKKYDDNLKFKEIALSIYFLFPNPTVVRYKDYLTLSKLLWVLNYMDISIEIQNKVKSLFIDKNGRHTNSSEEAEAYLQIGFTYQSKGEYSNALKELQNATRIFGNKYSAAMAHLAQAKLFVHEEKLDEIEPLLKESLRIREEYWKGTISEAASCHLYAKTLSAFGEKLEYAISLEKRAYQIFSKLQPNGVNVSSAAYILGWLFIQTSEDSDDIEYGIGKLEEAKEIRISYRGDPLHPWMEDIYLKLGQAYERFGDHHKALDYYKLLLSVRLKKFDNDRSNTYVLETYKLLQNIYVIIGDKEGEKECRRNLRYSL